MKTKTGEHPADSHPVLGEKLSRLRDALRSTASALSTEVAKPKSNRVEKLMEKISEYRGLINTVEGLDSRIESALANAPRTYRTREGDWLPSALRDPLLVTVYEMGGVGNKKEVAKRVYEKIEKHLTPDDRKDVEFKNGDRISTVPQWRVRLYTARQEVMRRGLMGYGRTRSNFKLTKAGMAYLVAEGLVVDKQDS